MERLLLINSNLISYYYSEVNGGIAGAEKYNYPVPGARHYMLVKYYVFTLLVVQLN